MKGHKSRDLRGDEEFEEDLRDNPEDRVNAKKIAGEAEERKHGGRLKRRRGGQTVVGHMGAHHAGRKPRKAGGRAGSDRSPLSSAHSGTLPPHHRDARLD